MKRLLLMGGRPWVAGLGGQDFVEALFRYHTESVKLAFCIFAQPEDEWDETIKWNSEMFDKFKGDRTIEYKTMTAENFEDVSAWADIIYVPGGNVFTLLDKLKPYYLDKLWDDKVVAGSSAGADLLCAHFVSLQHRKLGDGLGWVPVTCVPHWRDEFEDYTADDWDWAEQEPLRKHPKVPVLGISEGRFVEYTVN